jgi:signal transduction histidine kinase
VTKERVLVRRFVVVAPIGRDGELICALLKNSGFIGEPVTTVGEAEEIHSSLLMGLILTDEALTGDGIDALRRVVAAQPPWSDLPVMLLTSGPNEPRYAAIATQLRMEIRSLILIDRPMRKELLLSAVQVAYTSRLKQLQVRDAAARQTQSDEALRNSEKLAVAGRLAATMAHEVSNPLEAMSNLLYLVENCTSLEDAQTYGRMATQELKRVSEIIDRTLRFHRAPPKPALIDLSALASSALALFRRRILESQIRETVVVQKCYAYCSEGEIRQALVNLIGNAIDAMAEGGHLHLRVARVSMLGIPYARLTVADTGSGIRREIRKSLFTQFFTTKGSRGTGLGLWLTRDIVQRNRGKLRFRSRVESPSGTVFSIYLPSRSQSEMANSGSAPQEGHRVKVEAA